MLCKYALDRHYNIYPIIEIVDDMVYINHNGIKAFLFDYEIRAYSDFKSILYFKKIFKR